MVGQLKSCSEELDGMDKGKWRLLSAAVAAGLMIVTAGCSDEDEVLSDREALMQLMLEEADMETDVFSGDDGMEGSGGGVLDDPITPARWGRYGQRNVVSVNVEIDGDTLATLTRTVTFNGEFRVGVRITDTTFNVYSKPMHNTIIRKAHAVRIGDTPNPRRNWRISEVTPAVLSSGDPNPHTIHPLHVQAVRVTAAGDETIVDISDPLNTYLNRENLPDVHPNDSLKIFATANVSDAACAFLHPHVYRHGRVPRLRLVDDGTGVDQIAGDGVYSGAYRAQDFRGIFLSGIDFLDYETLFDSEAPYDAGAWVFPYRVVLQ